MQNKASPHRIAGGWLLMMVWALCNPVYDTGDKVVIRVGKVVVTVYELEKNLALFSADFSQKSGHAPVASDTRGWIQSFVDRTYFLADAYHKGYDTLSEVNGWVRSMEHYIIAQKGGLLDKKMDSASFYEVVKKEAQIKTNPRVLSVLENYLSDRKNIRTFEKNHFPGLLSDTLLTYQMSGRPIPVQAGRFMDYYNTLPLRKEIKDTAGLVSYMESMVYDAIAYRKAEELGITKETSFILDRENYKKNVVWASYETKELKKGLVVSDEEAMTKYEAVKDSLVQATDVIVSTYAFTSRQGAFRGMAGLKNGRVDSISGAKILDRSRSIHYQDVFFGDSIKALLFTMRNNDMTMPIPLVDRFVVIVKESESGRRIQTFPEARKEIVRRIAGEKLARRKEALLARLKTLYRLKDNIDYPRYLGTVHE